MILYLTSSFISYQEMGAYEKSEPGECYGFFEDLKKEWPQKANILYVPCDPDAREENEHQLKTVLDTFEYAGLNRGEVRILDGETKEAAKKAVALSNVIYLAGGHAPTQLAFMKRIGLKDILIDYEGIVIGLSAGSVNSAFYVYLMPELEGEATDPNYIRFSDGLDLTNIQMIPHRESMKEKVVDGLNFIEDIVIPDSFGCRFYIVSDGSYFKVKNGKTTFRGKGEIIEDGMIHPLKQGTIVPYMSYVEQPVIRTVLSEGYDMVVTVHKQDEHCEVYYLYDRLGEVFESSKLRYRDICFKLSQKVVEEERECFLDQLRLSVILEELADRGSYVKTIHIDTENGRRAKNIRARDIPGYPDWIMIIFLDITTFLDHDWMTDEYARTGFMERASLFISEYGDRNQFSLVYTNVKGFKAVNELFGDKNGDLVIFQTRDALRKYLKPVILGRLESDHFVLITQNENLTEKNLRAMCSQIFNIESKEYSYEIRCGIYAITNSQVEITQLLAGAKLAEKSIVTGKRNLLYAYYDDAMKENYVKQRFLLSDFERGIIYNEFEPFYQPIVDAKTGEIVSAEMLIRWRHRDLGMVSPGDFVPVIESEGKISALDNFMVERGMKFIQSRVSQGKRAVPCAMNLSRVDFYDSPFIESIFERITALGIDPSMVRFEVTESAYADLESRALEYLDRMKERGIKILLDDYGSGMSSLSMLETFDFDIIKLDIGFVRKIGINDKVESIIMSTINLAHSIGAEVTAEGVETDNQLTFLQNAGCDYIQGYYFYKPLPEKDFAKLL
jgi:EAL domain-containing protein (putative c-di-GMP-specific phosphodiesterase class I)/GGDEF domain-containing protein/peptidase E